MRLEAAIDVVLQEIANNIMDGEWEKLWTFNENENNHKSYTSN